MRQLLAALAVALLACASRPTPADVDALRRSALVTGDAAQLDAVFDDDLRYGHTNGQVQTKHELMAVLASGAVDYERIDAIASTRRHGDTLVVTGNQDLAVRANGRPLSMRSVFTAVYRWTRGGWQLIAYQSAPVPSGDSR